MSLSLRPEHLRRYKDLARLLFKYGRGSLVRNAGLAELLPEDSRDEGGAPPEARELADDLEQLGPTFIKLGQLLSIRPDIVPPAYAQAAGGVALVVAILMSDIKAKRKPQQR